MICAGCHETIEEAPGRCPACGEERLLDGRYRLDEQVGQGARGAVFRATALPGGETVAVKVSPLSNVLAPKVRELYEREARVLRQLDHPSIVRYRDHRVVGDGGQRSLAVVTEFVEGQTLADEAARIRPTELQVLTLLDEMLSILEYLHGLAPPVIHRDIKPGNIIRRTDDRRLVLVDFGSVRDVIRDPETGGSTLTGTFGYMAPEQFEGDASPATDIYGLGAMAVALLSGREPAAMTEYDRRFRWEDRVRVHRETRKLLAEMLEPDPEARASDAAEIRARIVGLRMMLEESGLPAYMRPRDVVRRRTAEVLMLVAFAAGTLFGVFLHARPFRSRPVSPAALVSAQTTTAEARARALERPAVAEAAPITPVPPACDGDEDGDGYGEGCAPGPDCDDGDASVHPGALELPGDRVDQDCDGRPDNCPPYAPDAATVALWHLDGSGPVVADATAAGRDGTAYGATRALDGVFAAAFRFDGVDDRAVFNQRNLAYDTFTVEFWVRTTASGGVMVCRDIVGPGSDWQIGVAESGAIRFSVRNHTTVGGVPINDGRPHHGACPRDERPGEKQSIGDGAVDVMEVGPTGNVSGNTLLGLGDTNHGTPHDPFEGILDEVRISSVVRSPAELKCPEG